MKTKLLALLLSSAALMFAAPKQHVYNAPFDKVWMACVQTASEKFTVTFSDKASGVMSFKQGVTLTSYGLSVGVTVVATDDEHTTVTLNPQKEKLQVNGGGSLMQQFFDLVDKRLKK